MTSKQKSKYDIRKATPNDSRSVFNIISSCTEWLSKKGMNHWKGQYTEERIRSLLQNTEVYLIFDKGMPVGTISMSQTPPEYYKEYPSFWKDEKAKAVYLRAGGILPSYHGRGLMGKLFRFVETIAKERGIEYSRFNTWAADDRLVKIFTGEGYELKGYHVDRNFFEKALCNNAALRVLRKQPVFARR